ncbi:(2Fe-2S)-binding protein [Paenibacillus whitsoniae]|uniref:(2Fe-2S)-binding protein n=1 Tax=Paenibacillus whitsoniae TaxID=2496558 RepID=A0A430JKN2_9BACL|nr:(2Fe-2S)-binding protein [Paenibacillus whitsoniae]RTE11611.1 (2Fe-2S)-binding protein [Paenibacillus whitsoniae]
MRLAAERHVDFSIVERYLHISPQGMDNPLVRIPGAQLLEEATMRRLLSQGQTMLKGKGLDIAASHMGLTMFNVISMMYLFMAQYNLWLSLLPEDLEFQIEQHDDHAHAGFQLLALRWKEVPLVDRAAFIEQEMRTLMQTLVIPVINVTAASAKVNPSMIWNQFGARMVFLRDFVLENDPRPHVREQFVHDYEVLSKQLTPDVFERKTNPFDHEPTYLSSPYEEGKRVILRSSCCFYYRRENGEKCFTCPLLNNEQREQMREDITRQRTAASEATAG